MRRALAWFTRRRRQWTDLLDDEQAAMWRLYGRLEGRRR